MGLAVLGQFSLGGPEPFKPQLAERRGFRGAGHRFLKKIQNLDRQGKD